MSRPSPRSLRPRDACPGARVGDRRAGGPASAWRTAPAPAHRLGTGDERCPPATAAAVDAWMARRASVGRLGVVGEAGLLAFAVELALVFLLVTFRAG